MKGAVEVLSRHMALELGPRGIAVNVVAPGPVATDFSGGMVRDNPAVNKRIAQNTALGRAGVPDELGPVIVSLLSEENRWVNAQRIERRVPPSLRYDSTKGRSPGVCER
jgi:NAD(P)-dependent dehydrogenase (short-subunit alcohol dehydrogenase family)